MPLEATDQTICMACETKPLLISRTHAAVRYDELTRSLALKLKYGRRVGLAKVMGKAMARTLPDDDDAIVVPVPLHRRRLWARGFNQAGLLAREIGRLGRRDVAPDLLQRVRATKPMANMTPNQREKNIRGAFAMRRARDVEGRRIILVDDVLTSGATLDACAKTLLDAGAERVDAVIWARVVRPRDIAR